ncbi:hypothetical protein L484_008438 [Morus notabilis]|uniref:Serine-rich protein n=1 Tax=Morus notabilis TaxID=981085 RepID=W9S3C5_9ROSA|nr:hypothetical protein L484_008438 [Morus notabilis]
MPQTLLFFAFFSTSTFKFSNTRSSSQSFSAGFTSSRAFLSYSSSPIRVSMYGNSISPRRRSMSVTKQINGNGNCNSVVSKPKKTCMCAPTTHPGSFRCYLHKNSPRGGRRQQTSLFDSNSIRFCLTRSAMANSPITIGLVEGELMKRSLLVALIRPSSNQLQRRDTFRPRPS